jgi:hypothetical protein
MNVSVEIAANERATRPTRQALRLQHANHTKDLLIDPKILPDGVARREHLPRNLVAEYCHGCVRLHILIAQVSTARLSLQVGHLCQLRQRAETLRSCAERVTTDLTANGL